MLSPARAITVALFAAVLTSQGPPAGFTYEALSVGQLDNASAMAFAPDGRLFLTERVTGRIRVFKDGALEPAPWATVATSGAATWGEQGLLGIAVDPDFLHNRFVYVFYTEATANENVVDRFEDSNGVGVNRQRLTKPNTIPTSWYHNGGAMVFGQDGKLFLATGDGWWNSAEAQSMQSLRGKVLRFNAPDLSIPADNPFPDSPIYSFGHRNHFGLCVHPVTGVLYQTENGGALYDELNLITPGRDYGWPRIEGIEAPPDPDAVDPLRTYQPTEAPTGCCFYSGDNYPAVWRNRWFYTFYNGGDVHAVDLDSGGGAVLSEMLFHDRPGAGYAVASGPDGNLWFLSNDNGGYGANRLGRYVHSSEPFPSVNALAVSNRWIGGSTTICVHGQNGGLGLSWISASRLPAPIATPWGAGWVLPDILFPAFAITADNRGYVGVVVPQDPTLLNLEVHMQGAAVLPSGALVLTNAIEYVLRG
jgi:glucose/arabinose dehydrogenase